MTGRIAVHLIGEQPIPVYMGIRQFPADLHLLLATELTEPTGCRLASKLRGEAGEIKTVRCSAYDIVKNIQILERELSQTSDADCVFNLTGGTKPMFVSAYHICRQNKAAARYIDTFHRCIINLDDPSDSEPLRRWLDIDTFISLSGFKVLDRGIWADNPRRAMREKLSREMWLFSRQLGALYKKISPYNNQLKQSFSVVGKEITITHDASGRGLVKLGNDTFEYPDFPDIAFYCSGGWFEEYSYLLLHEKLDKGEILDLRIGLKPDWENTRETVKSGHGIQELDLVYTDGFELTIGECKAGAINQTHIQTLENNVRRFGGSFGNGVILSPFHPYGNTEHRIRGMSRISGYFGLSVANAFPQSSLSLKSGLISTGPIPRKIPKSNDQ